MFIKVYIQSVEHSEINESHILRIIPLSYFTGEYESCPSNYVSAGESTCLSIG